jgi:hypothetical protein
VLFRKHVDTDAESVIAGRHLTVLNYRSEAPPRSLVVGRYAGSTRRSMVRRRGWRR